MGKRDSINGGWSNFGGLIEPSLMSTTTHLGKMKMTEHPMRHPYSRFTDLAALTPAMPGDQL
jgi:hypothetical protein